MPRSCAKISGQESKVASTAIRHVQFGNFNTTTFFTLNFNYYFFYRLPAAGQQEIDLVLLVGGPSCSNRRIIAEG